VAGSSSLDVEMSEWISTRGACIIVFNIILILLLLVHYSSHELICIYFWQYWIDSNTPLPPHNIIGSRSTLGAFECGNILLLQQIIVIAY
jgi:hypothetical protein